MKDIKNSGKNSGNLKPTYKKGESGNPNGRPKGQRNYATIYRLALERIGETQKMTPEEVEEQMEQVGLLKAMKGDFNFQKDIKDRLHGKPLVRSEVSVDLTPNEEDREKASKAITDYLN